MRMTKVSLNASSPALPQERFFYTEADIIMIIKRAVQEAIATMMVDEQPGNAADDDQKKPEKLTVSVQEAADIVGVSKPTMFELIHTGSINHKRIGKKILISYKNLVDWVNAN
jgi:excisionase family DNA binding protein